MRFRDLTHSRFLCGFMIINLLAGIAAGILLLAIPLYALALKANVIQMGLVSGTGGIGRLLFIVLAGLLLDRYPVLSGYSFKPGNLPSLFLLPVLC